MNACVLKEIGRLCYESVENPKPARGEVLLHIKYCGICSSDIDRIFKTGTYHFPTIPGHEFSGEIVELGEDVDGTYLGKRAVVYPLLPCFHCPSCEVGEYARCDSYSYFGSRRDGAFAEYVAVPIWNLVRFSDKLPFDLAALCEPATVALHAIRAAHIALGDTVVVIGSGTIGLLASMWARIHGASKVIVVGRGEEKLKTARELGFQHIISTLTQDAERKIRALTEEKGADTVLEMVGSSSAIRMAVCCVKKGGTVVLTGNPSGNIELERNVYWKILREELTLRGTWNSSYNSDQNDWTTVLEYMEKGILSVEKLITHQFPLREWKKAFEVLQNKENGAVKVMFRVSE